MVVVGVELCVQSPLEEKKYLFNCIFSCLCSGVDAALSSETQHEMSRKFGGKCGTECLNTRLPPPAVCRIHREADKFLYVKRSNYLFIQNMTYLTRLQFILTFIYLILP